MLIEVTWKGAILIEKQLVVVGRVTDLQTRKYPDIGDLWDDAISL